MKIVYVLVRSGFKIGYCLKFKENFKSSELTEKFELILFPDPKIFLSSIPNLIDDDVPEGKDEEDNLELRTFGKVRSFDFAPKNHLELGSNLNGIDMESGVKITGARFAVLNGDLARLQRSLINFIQEPIELFHKFFIVIPPIVVIFNT